jgi:hypothetical protein
MATYDADNQKHQVDGISYVRLDASAHQARPSPAVRSSTARPLPEVLGAASGAGWYRAEGAFPRDEFCAAHRREQLDPLRRLREQTRHVESAVRQDQPQPSTRLRCDRPPARAKLLGRGVLRTLSLRPRDGRTHLGQRNRCRPHRFGINRTSSSIPIGTRSSSPPGRGGSSSCTGTTSSAPSISRSARCPI